MTINCQSIKVALTEHLIDRVEVQTVRDMCIATLPLLTVDGRWVDVFIEPRATDFVLVHDGGKAVNELIVQGVKVTDSIHREFSMVASAMGVTYRNEMFEAATKMSSVSTVAYAVAMCSAIAAHRLVDRVTIEDEQSLHDQLGTILKRWGRKKANVTEHVKVNGELRQHTFDFLISLRKGPAIAVSILNPTGGPLAAAERFGFRAQDIGAASVAKKWPLLAIESRSEIWTPDARRIVQRFADSVIEVQSGSLADYEQVGVELDRIVAA